MSDEVQDSWDYGSRLPQDPAGSDSALLPGAEFGRYRVTGSLGAGGMGVVYRVHDPELGRDFALKVLKASSPERHARFLREGRLTAALRHPGIVRIHTAGEANGRPYLLYELLEGSVPLSERLASATQEQRVGWVLEVARAVGHAHTQGVVHRDLKAENVLLDEQGRARVIDFGLAFSEEADRLTRSGATPGTPRCMAPEQLAGDRPGRLRVAPTLDVWALGVLLYRCLTGGYPFEGGTLFELAAQICGEAPTPPGRLCPGLSPAVEAVCLRALEKDPARRYADGDAFADALEAALRDPSRGRPRTVWALLGGAILGLGVLAAALPRGSGAAGPALERPVAPVVSASTPPDAPAPALDRELALRRAQFAWEREDFVAASAAYAELVQASPEDPELRIALASARYRAGAVDEALPELKAAIDLLEATGDGAKTLGARLEAWAQRGWVRYRLWGPSSAPRVFLPAPFDFARASPEENVNAQLARHSALQGDPLAQIKLASFMGEGHWLEQDLEGGGQILQRWSFAGHSEAQYRFFELLLRETPAWSGDAPAAEAWLRAAVAQGNENARDRQLRRAAKQR